MKMMFLSWILLKVLIGFAISSTGSLQCQRSLWILGQCWNCTDAQLLSLLILDHSFPFTDNNPKIIYDSSHIIISISKIHSTALRLPQEVPNSDKICNLDNLLKTGVKMLLRAAWNKKVALGSKCWGVLVKILLENYGSIFVRINSLRSMIHHQLE